MEELRIDLNVSEEERYEALYQQLNYLIDPEFLIMSNLANFTAALKQTFEKISWAGFYLFKNGRLELGPFQGKVACTTIETGKGVCGSAFLKKQTIIVEDVNLFPGHIACDPESKSEIVIPLIKGEKIYGVLDLDSASYSSFNESDRINLEKLCGLLLDKIDIANFNIN